MTAAEELSALGIEVTSTWLDEPYPPNTQLLDVPHDLNIKYAQADVRDIAEADTFVFFSVPSTRATLRGGRHVEFGMALALGKNIVIVGPKENIFHHLPTKRLVHVGDWSQAVTVLQQRVAATV